MGKGQVRDENVTGRDGELDNLSINILLCNNLFSFKLSDRGSTITKKAHKQTSPAGKRIL